MLIPAHRRVASAHLGVGRHHSRPVVTAFIEWNTRGACFGCLQRVLPRSRPTVLFSLLRGQFRCGMLCVLLETGTWSVRSLVDDGFCFTSALVGYRNWAYDTD